MPQARQGAPPPANFARGERGKALSRGQVALSPSWRWIMKQWKLQSQRASPWVWNTLGALRLPQSPGWRWIMRQCKLQSQGASPWVWNTLGALRLPIDSIDSIPPSVTYIFVAEWIKRQATTVEVHHFLSEAPHLRSSILIVSQPKTDCSATIKAQWLTNNPVAQGPSTQKSVIFRNKTGISTILG